MGSAKAEVTTVDEAREALPLEHDARCRHFRKDGKPYEAHVESVACSCDAYDTLAAFEQAVRADESRRQNDAFARVEDEYRCRIESANAENRRLREALAELIEWAEAARDPMSAKALAIEATYPIPPTHAIARARAALGEGGGE